MARPPHSSAFPDTGGAPVPPYPQLMRQAAQPSQPLQQQHRRPSMDISQDSQRRASGEYAVPTPGRSLPVQPGQMGGPPRHSAVPDYNRMMQMGGMQSVVPGSSAGGMMQQGRPGGPPYNQPGRGRTSSIEQSTPRVVLPPNTIEAIIHESPDEGDGSDASSVGDDMVIEDVKPTGNKNKKAKTGDGEATTTGFGAGLASLGLNKEKRKRQVQSCSECRRRKIKCDKKFPCGPCVLRNDQSICREVEKHSPTSTGCASTQDLVNVQQRMAALEGILAQAGILAPGQLENILGGKGKLTLVSLDHTLPNGASTRAPGLGISASAGPGADPSFDNGDAAEGESDTEGAALTLEHLAFGRRKQEQGAGSSHSTHPNAGPGSMLRRNAPSDPAASKANEVGDGEDFSTMRTGSTAISKDPSEVFPYSMTFSVLPPGTTSAGVPANLLPQIPLKLKDYMSKPIESNILNALDPLQVFSVFYQRNDVFVKAILSVLPDRSKGELLVRSFIDRVEWLHRCLHVPSFLQQCEQFWNTPVQRVFTDVYMPFIGLYCIVCCLGLYFMDSAEASAHFSDIEQESLPEIWCTASRASLWMSDFVAVHTLENLQTIILLGVFLNNHDRADAAWSMLGASIKMAQGMGLSRLGAEPAPGAKAPQWKAPWESVIKREVGRRLWWNLVFLDWSLAPSYNFASSIQPDQIKTALPANVDDEDIIEGQPLEPKPLSTRTSMSYHLSRIRFAEISQRQIWQANASPHPPYSFILSVDTELRKAIADLPTFFSFEADSPEAPPTDRKSRIQYWEKIIINLSGQSRLMRLHRPWLSRGYKDKRYEYSRDQCIRAARSCLRIMQDEHGVAVFLEKWWIPLFYVTVAGVVVLIDLLRVPQDDLNSTENKEKEREILGALNQIKQVQHVSHPARGTIRVWEQLLTELRDRREGKPVLGKRKADGSDNGGGGGLQRAVKKLILDAQAVSPTAYSHSTPTDGSNISPNRNQPSRLPDSGNAPQSAKQSYMALPTDVSHDFMAPQMSAQMSNFPMGVSSAAMPGNTQVPGAAQFGSMGGHDLSLDNVSLQSMLATYLPNANNPPNGAGPDDFMNRVFEFSWDGNPQNVEMNGEMDYSGFNSNQFQGWMG